MKGNVGTEFARLGQHYTFGKATPTPIRTPLPLPLHLGNRRRRLGDRLGRGGVACGEKRRHHHQGNLDSVPKQDLVPEPTPSYTLPEGLLTSKARPKMMP